MHVSFLVFGSFRFCDYTLPLCKGLQEARSARQRLPERFLPPVRRRRCKLPQMRPVWKTQARMTP